jgi:hypothetical protein
MTDYLKCPSCNRKTEGIKDFISNVKNSTAVKKTCKKCRNDAYKSYRNKHPLKKKECLESTENTKKCPSCKKFNLNDDFIGKNNRKCRTCKSCRQRVLKSINATQAPKILTQKKKINIMNDFLIKMCDPLIIENYITENGETPFIEQVFKETLSK